MKTELLHPDQYPCILCSAHFATKEEQVNHLDKNHDLPTPWLCHQCPSSYTDERSLESHITGEHAKHVRYGGYPCFNRNCGAAFASEDMYSRHKKCDHVEQAGQEERKCVRRNCGYSNDSYVGMSLHVLHVHPPTCGACGKVFKEHGALLAHEGGEGLGATCEFGFAFDGVPSLEEVRQVDEKELSTAPRLRDMPFTLPTGITDVDNDPYHRPYQAEAPSPGHGVTSSESASLAWRTTMRSQFPNAFTNASSAMFDEYNTPVANDSWYDDGLQWLPQDGSATPLAPHRADAMPAPSQYDHPLLTASWSHQQDFTNQAPHPAQDLFDSSGQYSFPDFGYQSPDVMMDVYSPQSAQTGQRPIPALTAPTTFRPQDPSYPFGGQASRTIDPRLLHQGMGDEGGDDFLGIREATSNRMSVIPPQTTPSPRPKPLPPLPKTLEFYGFEAKDFDQTTIYKFTPARKERFKPFPPDLAEEHIYNADPGQICYDNLLRIATKNSNAEICRKVNEGRPQPVFKSTQVVESRIRSALAWKAEKEKTIGGVDAMRRWFDAERAQHGINGRCKAGEREGGVFEEVERSELETHWSGTSQKSLIPEPGFAMRHIEASAVPSPPYPMFDHNPTDMDFEYEAFSLDNNGEKHLMGRR